MKKIPPLADFISAGFLVTRPVARPSYTSADLMPERILSASGCIATFIPDGWCLEWVPETPEKEAAAADTFALDAEAISRVSDWVTPKFGESIGWPNVLQEIDTARELVEKFLNGLSDIKVLELALHRRYLDAFCKTAEPPPQQPGFAPMGALGVLEAIRRNRQPIESGDVLGFEPLVLFDYYSLACSWLCNHLETNVADHLGIKPNPSGLIDSFDEASRVVEYIYSGKVGAERGLWLPWLIIDHPWQHFNEDSSSP